MSKARRPQLYVILALRRKYAKLRGEGADLFADRERIRADLEHLGAVPVGGPC